MDEDTERLGGQRPARSQANKQQSAASPARAQDAGALPTPWRLLRLLPGACLQTRISALASPALVYVAGVCLTCYISLLTLQASGKGAGSRCASHRSEREGHALPFASARPRGPSPARVARQRVNSAAGSRLRGAGAGTATGALPQLPGGRRSGPRVRAGGGGRPRPWRRVEGEGGRPAPTQESNLRSGKEFLVGASLWGGPAERRVPGIALLGCPLCWSSLPSIPPSRRARQVLNALSPYPLPRSAGPETICLLEAGETKGSTAEWRGHRAWAGVQEAGQAQRRAC